MRIIVRNHCCLRAAALGGFLQTKAARPINRHEQESVAKAGAVEAEAAFPGGASQGICCQSHRVFRGGRFWRRNARPGTPARRDTTAAILLLSEQGGPDQVSLSHGLSRSARNRLGEAAGRSLPSAAGSAAG